MRYCRAVVASLLLLCSVAEGFSLWAPHSPRLIATRQHHVSRKPPVLTSAVTDEAQDTKPISDETSTITTTDEEVAELKEEIELDAEMAVEELMDEPCIIDVVDDVCVEGSEERERFRDRLKSIISQTLFSVRSIGSDAKDLEKYDDNSDLQILSPGEILERGWEKRANSSAIRRNAEVWKFALKGVFRALKPRKMRLKGATEEQVRQAQKEAAEFIRDGLLVLGPSFVKLGQVASTRTDVLPEAYTEVLKTLTDEVPGFSGARAKEIVSKELGRPWHEVFSNFSDEPLKAASLGQVHTAYYKGQKVAVKVQRAGLKELFDVDLKNLKKLAVLLDKFDPKSDGADRDWVQIYEESERLLYLEIDYLNEVRNTERFQEDFRDIDYVKIPRVIREVTTPRVLTMEFVESFKLTDIKRIEALGLDRKLLAKRVADTFLRQIIETAYFHADPHSGNLCVNEQGQLVFYDFGLMDELKPNVRKGFRTFCTALFAGGPKISDMDLARNAKDLVRGVEQAGVLSKDADRLAVEKLARFFMRTFKDSQLGKKGANIKETLGPDLQTLTENNSFRFPSTFTFIFRAFASIEGVGKELDPDFDIGKYAQPFVEKFTEAQKGYSSETEKRLSIFSKATGLNLPDLETAVTQPRKVQYIADTLRLMETGNLKIRVRSLENEKALERLSLRQTVLENLVRSGVFFQIAALATQRNPLLYYPAFVAAGTFIFQSLMASLKIKKFDKTQAKYVSQNAFASADDDNNEDD